MFLLWKCLDVYLTYILFSGFITVLYDKTFDEHRTKNENKIINYCHVPIIVIK